MSDLEPPELVFDKAALEALEAKLSAADGIDIAEFLAMLDEHFERARSPDDVQAYREGRKPWKKLADEVVPVAELLRRTGVEGRIRFPLNDQPPDAWLRETGSEKEIGLEVTRVSARSKFESARMLRDSPIAPGFLGLPDDASPGEYKAAVERGRITNSREGIESAIEASISERLQGKSDPKFQGHRLVLITPLSSAPRHDWAPLRERLQPLAQQTGFDRIYLVDEAKGKPPVVLFERDEQGAAPPEAEA